MVARHADGEVVLELGTGFSRCGDGRGRHERFPVEVAALAGAGHGLPLIGTRGEVQRVRAVFLVDRGGHNRVFVRVEDLHLQADGAIAAAAQPVDKEQAVDVRLGATGMNKSTSSRRSVNGHLGGLRVGVEKGWIGSLTGPP